MCGRYQLRDTDALDATIRKLYNIPDWVVPGVAKRYNVAPSQTMPVVVLDEQGRPLSRSMRWGMVPFWEKAAKPKIAPINARAEDAFTKPMFKQAVQRRRCLIPADGFYEWQEREGLGKQPYSITMKDDSIFFFAGIYEKATEIRPETYLLFTTTPNELMLPIHNRMPSIVTGDRARTWLEQGEITPDRFTVLTAPFPADLMTARPVSTLVNSPKNDTPLIFSGGHDELF